MSVGHDTVASELRVSVHGSRIAFPCAREETVLDAAERAGWQLPYSCRRGVCASCAGDVLSGSVRMQDSGRCHQGPACGVRLCQARPLGDLEIQPTSITETAIPDRQRVTARVSRIDEPSAGVRVLHLRFPTGRRVGFAAGQYLRVELADGLSRNYSLANAPHDNDGAVLHVRRLPGGRFSDTAVTRLRAGDELVLELPYGLCTLTDRRCRTVMLATGTGFAPLQSMVGELARGGNRGREVWLYWGVRAASDLYAEKLVRRWDAKYPWFHFVPVVSRGVEGSDAPRHVQDQALCDHPDLGDYEVYACGNPQMVADARAVLVERGGLPLERFHSDAFVGAAAADVPGAAARGVESSGLGEVA